MTIKEAAETIFTREDVIRIKEHISNNKEMISVDLHGLTVAKAKRLLSNIIALDKDGKDILIIHGYNHGTAIKDMVNDEKLLNNPRISKRETSIYNLGQTKLKIKTIA